MPHTSPKAQSSNEARAPAQPAETTATTDLARAPAPAGSLERTYPCPRPDTTDCGAATTTARRCSASMPTPAKSRPT